MTVEFKDLGLSDKTMRGIAGMGFSTPTEVQEKVIPHMLAGKEIIARSKTGSGKTCAFGISILELLSSNKAKKALIIAPVRELAIQIMDELRELGKFYRCRIVCVYGGQNIDIQIRLLNSGVNILVATPGRLLDLFDRGVVDLNEYDLIVLDEADKMFEMGFMEDVDKIISNTSYARKLHLFSATINRDVEHIVSKYVKKYEIVEVGGQEKPPEIKEEYIELERPEKFNKLVEIIKKHKQEHHKGKLLVFVATQRAAEYLAGRLYDGGIDTIYIHGDMRQHNRKRIMDEFKEGKSDILIATDIASRGLHIDNISIVINYDEAHNSNTHLHRIGRTGRMGALGKAITFVDKNPFFKKPIRTGFVPKVGPHNPYANRRGTSTHSSQHRTTRNYGNRKFTRK